MTKPNPFKEEQHPWITNVMPCHNDGKRVADAMMSVLNQDYPYTQLIVVNDGSTDNSRKQILKAQAQMTEDQKARFLFIDLEKNGGACNARNIGAEHRHEDCKYLSFLPADAFLYPGVMKFWVDELERHPEFAGIYGGYRFIPDGKPFGLQDNEGMNMNFPFFDPYLLEVNNYIDGTFPIRAELFDKMGGWDPEIKSLQDWEYWLRAVKQHDAKLLFSPALFFETDFPHKGGLSFDSNQNWLERTDQIKKKLGIPIRELCVMAFGAEFHAIKTAQMLDADFSTNPNFKPNHYQAIYIMGGYPHLSHQVDGALKKNDNKTYTQAKTIMHWIGSDLLALRKLSRDDLERYTSWLKAIIDVHLVEAPHTYKELFDLTGIKAKIVPLPSARMYDIKPFPKEPTIAVYQPPSPFNEMLYQTKLMEQVAAKMPDVKFIFYGKHEPQKGKKNISYRTFNMDPKGYEKLIEDSSLLLRITYHDGLPLSVGEFASAGRHIVTNVPIPHVRHISGTVTVEGLVETIRVALKDGPNVEGAKYYTKLFDQDKFRRTMKKLMEYNPKEYWENRSSTWTRHADKYFDAHEQRVVKKVLAQLKTKSVLDCGCGNGQWSNLMPENYLGVDISKSLISAAKKLYPEREFLVSGLEDLDKKLQRGEKYDVAFCHTVLMHIPEKQIKKAISNLAKFADRAIIIEPNKIETGFYQIAHDIPKLFKVERTIPMPQRTLYVVNLNED
jgi:glycosyltransferase involved in cell wall biosynthesis